MYLSQLLLNPRHRQVQRELSDRYQLHRTLMRAFPDPLPPEERVLHRLEIDPHTGRVILLVQSQTPPDWSHLLEKPHYLLRRTPAVKSVELALAAGSKLRFRLRANPTRKMRSQRHPHKKTRVPLIHEPKQVAWLLRKGELHGFRVLQQRISQPETYRGRKDRNTPAIQVFTVQFDGILVVTDEDAFAQAITSGVGPAKSFGCGLLSLAPAPHALV